jgi:hypothetical protein
MHMSPHRRTVVGDVVPSRGAIAFAWAVSLAVFGLARGHPRRLVLLVSPVAMRVDVSNPLGVQWDSWASWLCLGLALLVGTLMITGGGSGLVAVGRAAGARRSGAVASWGARALRPMLLGAVVLAVSRRTARRRRALDRVALLARPSVRRWPRRTGAA